MLLTTVSEHFGCDNLISIQFGSSPSVYRFTNSFLIDNFEYFKPCLEQQAPIWMTERSMRLVNVSALDFELISKWICRGDVDLRNKPISDILSAFKAADLLEVSAFQDFTKYVEEKICKLLTRDRLQLTQNLLKEVHENVAFSSSYGRQIRRAFAKAGVRPLMQRIVVQETKHSPPPKEPSEGSSVLTATHYRALVKVSPEYSQDVLEQVVYTVQNSSRRMADGRDMEYEDPLVSSCGGSDYFTI
jgi:hypothetical protein